MPVSRPVSTGGCDPAEIEALASRRALKRLAGRPSGVVDWWGGCGVMWSPPALLVRPSTRFLPPFSIAICPLVALNAGFWWSPRTSSCLSGPSKLVLVVVGLGHALVWFAVGVDRKLPRTRTDPLPHTQHRKNISRQELATSSLPTTSSRVDTVERTYTSSSRKSSSRQQQQQQQQQQRRQQLQTRD